jgi:hypothetical protein
VKINKSTRYRRTEAVWTDAEFYFYGKVTNAGGKDKANIHINTEELGTVRIQTPISFLEQYNENLLYKAFGIRATGKQHSETGEIDMSSLTFVELVDYQPKYDELYLKTLRDRAKNSWLDGINPDNWLNDIRVDMTHKAVLLDTSFSKLFAQADCEKAVEFYLSSDKESLKIYDLLRKESAPKFQFIDLNTPYNELFGLLDL